MIANQTSNEIEIQFDGTRALYVTGYFILIGIIAMGIWVIGHSSFLFFVAGAVFVVAGMFALYNANHLRSVFNKNSGLAIEKNLIISKKKTIRNIALADIASVHYSTTYRTAKDAQYRDGSSVSIVLRGGSKILIDEQTAFPQKTFMQIIWHSVPVDPLEPEAKTLAEFLNIPLTVTDLSSLRPFARR